MSFKVHPTSISMAGVGDVVSLLVYTSAPVTSNTTISVTSSDESVVSVSPASQVISVGGQDTTFEVSVVGEGVASLTVSDGVDTEVVPVDIAHVPQQIAYLPPKPVKAVLTGSSTSTISLVIQDVDDLMSTYSVSTIHFQVSSDGGGSYRDLTGSSSSPARVETTTGPSWDLDGTQLHLESDGDLSWDVTFVGIDPWSPQRVAEWLLNHTGLQTSVAGDVVSIETPFAGQHRFIQVTGGSAATVLGLSLDKVYGTDVNTSLAAGVINYTFYDISDPGVGLLYRYRLETDDGDYTQWSEPISCETLALVDDDDLCLMSITLVDEAGEPIVGHQVVVANTWMYVTVEGTTYSTAGSKWVLTTDENGHAEVKLLRGMVVEVSVAETPIVRTIKVPDKASADFFDPSIQTDEDRWSIVVDNTPSGLRF